MWVLRASAGLMIGASVVCGAPSPRPTTTIYVGRHFEVREHDAPVKYVFDGSTRVARVTGSLSANERIQRLRLRAGWNLVSLAVTAPDFLAQLGEFTSGPAPVIKAIYRWEPATRDYGPIASGESVAAGAVLWVSAQTNAVVAVRGGYVEPSQWSAPGGETFLATPALEAQPLTVPTGVTLWRYEARSGRWQAGLRGDLASLNDLPPTLAPGEAIYVHSNQPTDLGAPAAGERIRYYHQDHLGSSSVMTDADGALIEETAFYPFGVPRHEHRVRPIVEAYKYTQKERDRENSLDYFEARYLAGGLSRFVTADPKYMNLDLLSSADFAVPQALNLYGYVHNNPLKYADPTGLDRRDIGFDAKDIRAVWTSPVDVEMERLGNAVAFLPNAIKDGIAAVIGINTANAPGFNKEGKVVTTYPSLSYEDHAKNIAINVGGGKLVKTVGGKLLGREASGAGAGPVKSVVDPLPDPVPAVKSVTPKTWPGGADAPAKPWDAAGNALQRSQKTAAKRNAAWNEALAGSPELAWSQGMIDAARARGALPNAQVMSLIADMAELLFRPAGK